MAAGAPAPARTSGSSAASSPARKRAASTGAAPRATTSSMCASGNGRPRTRSGSGRTARPRWRSRRALARESKLDRTLVIALRACRSAGRCRRAGRPARPDASDRQPRRDRPHGRGHHRTIPTERASLPHGFAPAPLAEIVVISDLWSPIEEIRAIARRSFRRTARMAIWCRSSIRPRKPSPIPAASSSSSRKAAARSPPAAPRTGAPDYEARLARHRAEIRAETDKLGWSFIIHRTDRPAERTAAGAARPHRRRQRRGHRAAPPAARRCAREVRMMGLPLGFASPLVLLGLLSLPVLWWLLRLIPPRPRRIEFPPTRLLFDIKPKEDTPARTPWWLTLLRLTLAALVILAAAGPLWNPPLATTHGRDADRAADRRRLCRRRELGRARPHRRRPDRARRGRQSRRRAHPARRGRPRHLAANAGRRARAAQPDQAASRTPSSASMRCRRSCACSPPRPTWKSSGCPTASISAAAPNSSSGLAKAAEGRPCQRGRRRAADRACACRRRQRRRRADREGAARHHRGHRARRRSARSTSRACRSAKPASPSRTASARPTPSSTCRSRSATTSRAWKFRPRNPPARCNCSTSAGAGAPSASSPAPPPTPRSRCSPRPTISRRALNPFADVRLAERGAPAEAVRRFIEQNVPMIILADVGNVAGEARDRLSAWVEGGGMLVRFAGPAPRRLRRRSGAGEAAPRRPHPRRQPELGPAAAARGVLARRPVRQHAGAQRRRRSRARCWPSRRPGLTDRTWATLADGTPLVTARASAARA